MKKLITLTLLALAVASAHAGPLDVGGYFTINIPKAWRVTGSGQHLNTEGEDYAVFKATNGYSCEMAIRVLNGPGGITLMDYSNFSEGDLSNLATVNHRVGWSVPTVKKDHINGIPVLFGRQKRGNVRFLEVYMWIEDKSFVINFIYTMEAVQTINAIIDSIRPTGIWKCWIVLVPASKRLGVSPQAARLPSSKQKLNFMGLDQYLNKRSYVKNWDHMTRGTAPGHGGDSPGSAQRRQWGLLLRLQLVNR